MRARAVYRKLTGRKIPFDPCELSTPRIHQAVLEAIAASGARPSGSHLDIGSGGGQLLRLIGARYPVKSFACDYTDQLMALAGQEVQLADLNREPLPYASNQFSLVTCIETIGAHREFSRDSARDSSGSSTRRASGYFHAEHLEHPLASAFFLVRLLQFVRPAQH